MQKQFDLWCISILTNKFVLCGQPKDPWPRVLSLPGRFVGDPASLVRDNIFQVNDLLLRVYLLTCATQWF